MKALKPLLVAFSLAAFTGAYADDAKKQQSDAQAKPSMSQSDKKATPSAAKDAKSRSGSASAGASAGKKSFSELDKDNDGALSMTEAAADRDAKSRFSKLDKNADKKLSRSEYDAGHGAAAGGTAKKSSGKDTAAKKSDTATSRTEDKPAVK